MRRIILTEVPHYGWIPTVEIDGKETYRGEFRGSPSAALLNASIALAAPEVCPVTLDPIMQEALASICPVPPMPEIKELAS